MRIAIAFLFSVLFHAAVFAGGSMLLLGVGNAGVASITVGTNWGNTSGTTATIAGNTETLTVPAGNPGSILLNVTQAGTTSRVVHYSQNGGTNTVFTDGTTLSVANGDTFKFNMTNSASGDEMDITVTDNTTGVLIGTCHLIHT